MPKMRENRQENELAELRAWYLDGLRPKLADAASAGTVAPTAAVALDEQLRQLLDVRLRPLQTEPGEATLEAAA